MFTQTTAPHTAQMTFPGIQPNPIADRECVIAMLSEVAAEGMRLSITGAALFLNFNKHGLGITLWSPRPEGPVCRRKFTADKWDYETKIRRSGNERTADPDWELCDSYVSHDIHVDYDAPLDLADRAIAEIHQLFRQIESNPDAFLIDKVAA
ncbi:MAG: hypothetical protein GYB21_01015 [Oceanospirillales bacterium]|nr:hypothetical protein [Oceanospirillales bacterium]